MELKSAPKGAPIWGGFTVGMSHEDIRERFAMVEIPGEALQGRCVLFGIEAHLTRRVDPEGGLEALLLDVACRDVGHAAETLNHLFASWQGELHPTRFLGRVEERGSPRG
jgi:hypothetical protein